MDAVYRDALQEIRNLKAEGVVSAEQLEIVEGTMDLDELLLTIHAQIQQDTSILITEGIRKAINSLAKRLERFGDALDIIFQGVQPGVAGCNPVALAWGVLRFAFMTVNDVFETEETALNLLEDLTKALPEFRAYATIFRDSEIQMIKGPLVNLYKEIILFAVEAIKLVKPGFKKTAANGITGSLLRQVRELVKKTTDARQQVDRSATIEHYARADSAIQRQLLESQRAEEFRRDVRSALHIQVSNQPFSHMAFNDSPSSILTPRFIGRKDELSQLDTFFIPDVDRVVRRFSIFGMYGVGKTQLVLKFAEHKFPDQYQMIFWASANTLEKLNQSMTKILNLIGHMDRNHPEQSARLIASRRWLEDYKSMPGKRGWLLVVDNVENSTEIISFLRENLPRSSTGGDIIYTTREEKVAKELSEWPTGEHKIIQLKPPSENEAASLLLLGSRTPDTEQVTEPSEETRHLAERFASRLACLPLVVDNASAFMRQHHMSLARFVEHYEGEQRHEFLSWQNDLSKYGPASIARVFDLQLGELERSSPAARELLNVISFYDIAGIPLRLITARAEESLLSLPKYTAFLEAEKTGTKKWIFLPRRKRKSTTILVTKDDITPAIQAFLSSSSSSTQCSLREEILKLQDAALLEVQELESTTTVFLHELVRDMVHHHLKQDQTEFIFFKCAAALCCEAFEHIYTDERSSTSWADCEPFITHIGALSQYCDNNHHKVLRIEAANCAVARYLRARGRYSEAEELFKKALEDARSAFGENEPRTLQAMLDIAGVQRRLGRYEDAEILLRKVLEQQNSLLGSDNLTTLQTAQTLSGVLTEVGKGKEAKKLAKLSAKRAARRLGHHHPDTLRVKHNLALLYERLGDFDKAIAVGESVYHARLQRLGVEHADTQRTLQNLGVAHGRKGGEDGFKTAGTLLERVMAWRVANLGPAHCDTLQSMQNLANIYFEKGELARAEVLYVKALAGWRATFEPDHYETLQTMQNLAVLYERAGKYEQAEGLYNAALEGYETRLGGRDARTLRTVHNMGTLAERRGRKEEAEGLYRRALEEREKTLGRGHPDTKRTMARLEGLKRRGDD